MARILRLVSGPLAVRADRDRQSCRNDKVQCVHSNIAIFHAELGPDQSESRLDDRLHCKTEMEKNHVMFQMYR